MLLSTSPPTAAFMPMSADTSSYNRSDDDVTDGGESSAYGIYGRIKTFPVFPPTVIRPSQASTPAISVLHRRNSYNLSLKDFHQLTNLLEATDSTTTNANKSSSTRATVECKKIKKKVVFADDLGYSLAQIKIMTEPSDEPPKLRSSIVRSLLGETICDDSARPCSQWTLSFKQPASDYLSFRRKLDEKNVALENVLLKNEQCKIGGTVKVKNLSFEKFVFVRITDDKWANFVDHPCKFSPHISGGGGSSNGCDYDTFQFDFDVPCDDDKRRIVEFCVGFRTESGEYWDNNDGKNFKLIGEKYRQDEKADNNNNANNNVTTNRTAFIPFQGEVTQQPTSDAFTLNVCNWTQFASWNHLTTDGPYW